MNKIKKYIIMIYFIGGSIRGVTNDSAQSVESLYANNNGQV